ncbi:hypothetical protein GTP56_26785 [Duganella sp. FT134W]|uniref:DUF2884 family protein n=1 Tax=Duganella margarita TaxID=2692170 RepID=A0A7X4KJJ7_9BURK|nr:DUF6624 domain-containing protein [Duganella margarita]MYM75774.1 hypothetical protein [Duganella margarita]
MTLYPRILLVGALAGVALCGRAEDGLTQTTISFYADGKPVGGMIFAIGAKSELSVKANQHDSDATSRHFTGNVQARLIPDGGQAFTVFGENVVFSKAPISAEHAKAVRDLEAMAATDQLYRGRSVQGDLTPAEWQQQTAIDVANTRRLVEIIGAFGWPGLRFAGAASQTAFLVLQHADNDTQRKYLPLLRDAVKRSDARGDELAMLEDRVRIADGRPQLYGSQLGGTPLQFEPIEDEAHVDERRRAIGLPPMAEYAEMFGLTYTPVH